MGKTDGKLPRIILLSSIVVLIVFDIAPKLDKNHKRLLLKLKQIFIRIQINSFSLSNYGFNIVFIVLCCSTFYLNRLLENLVYDWSHFGVKLSQWMIDASNGIRPYYLPLTQLTELISFTPLSARTTISWSIVGNAFISCL